MLLNYTLRCHSNSCVYIVWLCMLLLMFIRLTMLWYDADVWWCYSHNSQSVPFKVQYLDSGGAITYGVIRFKWETYKLSENLRQHILTMTSLNRALYIKDDNFWSTASSEMLDPSFCYSLKRYKYKYNIKTFGIIILMTSLLYVMPVWRHMIPIKFLPVVTIIDLKINSEYQINSIIETKVINESVFLFLSTRMYWNFYIYTSSVWRS